MTLISHIIIESTHCKVFLSTFKLCIKERKFLIAIIFAQIIQLTWKPMVRDRIKRNVSGHDISGEEMLYDSVSIWVSWKNLEVEKYINNNEKIV